MFGDQSKQYLQELLRLANARGPAIGYQQLTVAGSVVKLTVPATAVRATIKMESSVTTVSAVIVRYTEDGTVPSTGSGMPLYNLDILQINGTSNLLNFQAIEEGAGTFKLNITYYSAS